MENVFEKNLKEGRRLEEAVKNCLKKKLIGYEVSVTDQEKDSPEREMYSCVDVIVRDFWDGGRPVLGVECKLSETKYEACKNRNGWDGDVNTPLNNTSLHRYKKASFPFYVVNINTWCHRAFAADIPTILDSPNDAGRNVKKSGVIIYNIDSSSWMSWEGEFTITDILTDILKKEGIC